MKNTPSIDTEDMEKERKSTSQQSGTDNYEDRETYNIVTPGEKRGGVSDQDVINWCRDGCRFFVTSTYSYEECVLDCLIG